eukprot:926302-Prymnesium_polylepis.1
MSSSPYRSFPPALSRDACAPPPHLLKRRAHLASPQPPRAPCRDAPHTVFRFPGPPIPTTLARCSSSPARYALTTAAAGLTRRPRWSWGALR